MREQAYRGSDDGPAIFQYEVSRSPFPSVAKREGCGTFARGDGEADVARDEAAYDSVTGRECSSDCDEVIELFSDLGRCASG